MLKHTALAALFALILTPTIASADLAADLQAMQLRVQQLLIEIARFQGQQTQPQTLTSPTSVGATSCISLSYNMGIDDTDADTNGEVTKLQQFLSAQGLTIYPEARITGYFGPATMRAVQRWQARQGIVSSGDPDSTGYGYVGRKTRAALQSCSSSASAQITYAAPARCDNGDDYYDGGDGFDTLTYTGKRSEFTITRDGNTYTFKDNVSCRAGTDRVVNVEQIQFADGVYNIETLVDWPQGVSNSATPACSIIASPNPASFNQQVTLTWTSKNAVSAQWQSDTSGKDNVSIPPGTPGLSGAAYIVANVMGNPTVTLRVFGSNGSSNTCTTSFSVPSAVPSISGYGNSYVALDPSSLNTMSQNPTITGSAGNLNGVAVQIYNNSNVGVSGTGFVPVTNGRWSVTVPQTLQPGIYKVEVLGAPAPVYGMLTIAEPVLPTPAITFSASTYSVESGQQATLSWNASNANRCTLQFDGVEIGGMPASGNQSVVVQKTTSYRLICTNDPGTGKDGPSSERTLTIQAVQSQALSCTLTSTSNYNSAGAAIPATLTWTSQNATHAIASQRQANNTVGPVSLGTVAANGSMVVNPGVTTDYTFTFYGSSGTKDCTYQLGYKG